VLGYQLYYGVASGQYSTVLDTGSATSASVGGLAGGQTYYFAATAYDAERESGFSNEVNYLVPEDPDEPPALDWRQPLDGSVVPRGQPVLLDVTVTGGEGVVRVRFSVNGKGLPCEPSSAPYQCTWLVPGGKNKRYRLQATARDEADQTAATPEITVSTGG
jgi:hypothetical protein